MLKRFSLTVFMLLSATMPALAQSPKAEVGVFAGWVFSDGVTASTSYVVPGVGTFDRVDPKDTFGWGFDVGVMVGPNGEVGFMYTQQPTILQAGGTTTKDIGDLSTHTYHGTYTYNFGESDEQDPSIPDGWLRRDELRRRQLHARQRRDGDDLRPVAVLEHMGCRREDVRGRPCRRAVRHSLDADLHQVRCHWLVVRSVLGLLRRRQCAVLEPDRHQRRRHVPLLTPRMCSVQRAAAEPQSLAAARLRTRGVRR